MKLLGGCIIWERLFHLSLFHVCLPMAFPVTALPVIPPACELLHLTRAEAVVYLYHHIQFLFFFKNRNVLHFLFLMPILFLARSGIQLWYALHKYSTGLVLLKIFLAFAGLGALVLDQDTAVLGAVQTERRQSLTKYCGLRITSYR